ncbi:MAG: beta-lactamase family protein [Congregibacter sp.]|nr:beta-lactamase family protein [Congregibacter sp.]
MIDELNTVLEQGVARGAVPGVTAIVVDRHATVYQAGFGLREQGSDVAMTADTVGKIFSMTKALTAAAAMQLVEQDKLFLDTPAFEICPDIGKARVLTGFDEGGEPLTRPPAIPVTLRHLLTHTAGFSYNIWDKELGRWHAATSTPTMASQQKAALHQPLMFDPGTQWRYGIGIDWVGQMIEAVTGMRLGEYFDACLCGPMGMIDTHFDYTPSMFARAAHLHARMPDGSLAPLPLEASEQREFDGGGDGLKGTMGDYGRFIRMLLNDGELDGVRILKADTVTSMVSNHIGPLRVQAMRSCVPAISNDGEFFPGESKSWGLSFQINETPGFTGRPAGTLMWAGLANSYFWIDRVNGIGGAFLSQILPFADPASSELFFEFESAVYKSVTAK